MKRLTLTLLATLFVFHALPWGKTGHRVVGLIAERHLTKKARKNVEKILGNETLAEVSNFMDFIRSDSKYDHMAPWHYATIPDGLSYEEAGTPMEGDIIQTINRLILELKTKRFTDEDEAFALKLLVHLVADIHQPLHVGTGEDKGGNEVRVDYFWKSSNLHKVWDTGMIDGQQLSYTEYASWIDHVTKSQRQDWQKDSVLDWAYESVSYRDEVYDLPESKKISYKYDYNNLDLVNLRLLQAGVRLAGVLNDIYG